MHHCYCVTVIDKSVRCLINGLHVAGIRAEASTVANIGNEAAQNVKSPVVVVTGASRGIGKAIALALGRSGCKVAFFALCLVWVGCFLFYG